MEHSDFKEELDKDQKRKIKCFKCDKLFYPEALDLREQYKAEITRLQESLKELKEKDFKEYQIEYSKSFKLIKEAYVQTVQLEVVDQSVPDDICRTEVTVSFHLCPSCLTSLMEDNGYECCEKCERYTKSMSSICTDPGRTSGPPEDCYPAEYDDCCEDCAEKANDYDDGPYGGDGPDD